MINLTDMELRFAAHAECVTRVNNEGWTREAPVPAVRGSWRGIATRFALSRRIGGVALQSERIEPLDECAVAPVR